MGWAAVCNQVTCANQLWIDLACHAVERALRCAIAGHNACVTAHGLTGTEMQNTEVHMKKATAKTYMATGPGCGLISRDQVLICWLSA